MAPEVRFEAQAPDTVFEHDYFHGRTSLSPGSDHEELPEVVDPDVAEAQSQSQTQLQTQLLDGPFPTLGGADSENPDVYWGSLQQGTPNAPLVLLEKGKESYTIGRLASNDIIVQGRQISGMHCEIRFNEDEGIVMVKDHSKNGTYVNGKLIGKGKIEVLLSSCDITLGHVASEAAADEFRFLYRPPNVQAEVGGGIWDEYQALNVLGKGAFGLVRKVHHRESGRMAAVKIFSKARFMNDWPKLMKDFEKEIKIISNLHHTNIVQFYGEFEDPFSLYIVMELVNGGDMLTWIQEKGIFDEPLTQRMTRQICEALDYSHMMGVTHRDLKPENILLTKEGIPKIADFGLAKMIDSQTFLKTMCGTPQYLAPEIIEGTATGYSSKVDSWSLGLIVYAMMTGHLAFIEGEGSNWKDQFANRTFDYAGLEVMSPALRSWLDGMIRADPETRFSMKQALDHHWLNPDADPSTPVQMDLRNSVMAMRQASPTPFASSFDRSPTRSTPGLTPSHTTPASAAGAEAFEGEEECSQDLEALHLDTDVNIETSTEEISMGGLVSRELSTAESSANLSGIMSAFPSVPNESDMPYPDKYGQEESPIVIARLASAWSSAAMVNGATPVGVPARLAAQDTIMPAGAATTAAAVSAGKKRKVHPQSATASPAGYGLHSTWSSDSDLSSPPSSEERMDDDEDEEMAADDEESHAQLPATPVRAGRSKPKKLTPSPKTPKTAATRTKSKRQAAAATAASGPVTRLKAEVADGTPAKKRKVGTTSRSEGTPLVKPSTRVTRNRSAAPSATSKQRQGRR